jgi:hypothetical protein
VILRGNPEILVVEGQVDGYQWEDCGWRKVLKLSPELYQEFLDWVDEIVPGCSGTMINMRAKGRIRELFP